MGEILNKMKNGKGKYVYENKDRYDGLFLND
jgi:hypothetical protein